MDKEEISRLYQAFINNYDKEKSKLIWIEKSKQFRDFWNNRILNNTENNLNEAEVDQIIRILDKKAKGNTKNDQAVANCMTPQGVWRRLFNEIKQNKELQNILTKIFQSEGEEIISLIDTLYKINEGKKNSLTGKSANVINAMLFAFNPNQYLSVVSLNERKKIIEFFNFNNSLDFEKDSQGKRVFLSNQIILNGFKEYGLEISPRDLSNLLCTSLKNYWRMEEEKELTSEEEIAPSITEKEIPDSSLFYMEKELENFLITNWDKTELGRKYELIEEDGELVSQQYNTSIGKIDILARDKKTKQYVIIELKRNQTSDDTVGQLTRYMGWIEENKSKNVLTKGIIISAKYDERLYYALKKIKDVDVYLYQIDFKLREFKKED
jgi:hypothetical protein